MSEMLESFDDDEPIVAIQDVSGGNPTPFVAGKTKATIINKTEAPLEECEFKVMLELTGAGSGHDRSGVDLVMILDVSGSMGGKKLEKMKIAMQFVIKKLSSIDRLSVVTFARDPKRLCPLRQITENSQMEIEILVNNLVAKGSTNIAAGLQMGLNVLNNRQLISERVAGIMLMSDGEQNADTDAAQVPVGNVPVYTFGFGTGCDPWVLKAVADNSMGGTFSDVQNLNNLSIAFSQCLAGLLTVVVQDLKLTITQDESTIEEVSAGNYPQLRDDASGSATVSFGDLYDKEIRKVIVDLLLPAVADANISRVGADILKITYSYSTGKKLFDAPPLLATVTRIWTSVEPEREEVINEENRLRTAQMMKEARVMAEDNKLTDAQNKLVEAKNLLNDAVNEPNPLIEILKSEVQQLLTLMSSPQIYKKQGLPYALSSEAAHDRQRHTTKGDVKNTRLFSTQRMDAFLEQAMSFDEDPNKPLPTEDEDVKQELAAYPLPTVDEDVKQELIVVVLSYTLMVIQFLESIFNMFNRSR